MRRMTSNLASVIVFTLLCAATIASSRVAAQTVCSQWNINGQFTLVESQTGLSRTVWLTQTENGIKGNGAYSNVKGAVEGTLNGNSLEFAIQWERVNTMAYSFKINSEGLIQGYAYNQLTPAAKTDWYAKEFARCEDENVALAVKGEALANRDPLTLALRNLQPEGPTRRGFDIGMAATERDTALGPGKQRIMDSLPLLEERIGFTRAEFFLLARNKNAKLAAKGAAIAQSDTLLAEARAADSDPVYQLGFDIATGLFGDPAKGAEGNTLLGPGSLEIRNGLRFAGSNGILASDCQRGFDAAFKFHSARKYR